MFAENVRTIGVRSNTWFTRFPISASRCIFLDAPCPASVGWVCTTEHADFQREIVLT